MAGPNCRNWKRRSPRLCGISGAAVAGIGGGVGGVDELKTPFEIDEGRLDFEWLRQPRLTRRAGEREADARHAVAQAKARLDVCEAQLRRAVRRNPGDHALKDKPTEGAIGEVVILHPDYQRALAEYNDAKLELDLCSADASAMMDRRRALERLVELLNIDYFSEPRARGEHSRAAMNNAAKTAAREPVKRAGRN